MLGRGGHLPDNSFAHLGSVISFAPTRFMVVGPSGAAVAPSIMRADARKVPPAFETISPIFLNHHTHTLRENRGTHTVTHIGRAGAGRARAHVRCGRVGARASLARSSWPWPCSLRATRPSLARGVCVKRLSLDELRGANTVRRRCTCWTEVIPYTDHRVGSRREYSFQLAWSDFVTPTTITSTNVSTAGTS